MTDNSSVEDNKEEMEIEENKNIKNNNKKFNLKPIKERETSRFLTKYERAKILGERAIQISNGAKVMVDVDEGVWDPMIIAEKELREKKINYVVRRYLPDGLRYDRVGEAVAVGVQDSREAVLELEALKHRQKSRIVEISIGARHEYREQLAGPDPAPQYEVPEQALMGLFVIMRVSFFSAEGGS